MASTYSPSLKLELIGNGDQSGTWGTTTNNNLGTLLEQAITGVQSITMLNANYTLTNYNGTTDEARNAVLVVGGTNSAIRQIICPLVNKLYIVKNATSGGYAITVGGATGSTVTIPNGITAQVYCDGTNFYSSQTGSAGDFTVNGTLYATGNEALTGNLTIGGNLAVTGTTTFTGVPSGPTAAVGTNTTQLATTAFVLTNGVPTGVILMWGAASIPSGYLLCNGAAISRSTYANLFAVIGTTYGAGDGSTTFNLPTFTGGVMPLGSGGSYALASQGGSADAITVSHTHTATSSVTDPGHNHAIGYGTIGGWQGPWEILNYDNSYKDTTSATTGITVSTSIASAGSSGTGANLPPYLAINFMIKT